MTPGAPCLRVSIWRQRLPIHWNWKISTKDCLPSNDPGRWFYFEPRHMTSWCALSRGFRGDSARLQYGLCTLPAWSRPVARHQSVFLLLSLCGLGETVEEGLAVDVSAEDGVHRSYHCEFKVTQNGEPIRKQAENFAIIHYCPEHLVVSTLWLILKKCIDSGDGSSSEQHANDVQSQKFCWHHRKVCINEPGDGRCKLVSAVSEPYVLL